MSCKGSSISIRGDRMEAAFLKVLNMSLTASYVIIFVWAARLLLKKAPKIFSYALWGVVLFRLLCPFSFESLLSLLFINANPIPENIAYFEVPYINTGINLIDNVANPILSTQGAMPDASVNPLQIWLFAGSIIWLAGMAVLLIYSLVSLLRLRSSLVGAVKWRDNIYLADHTATPFVMGVLRPKIYLPSSLSEQERCHIILHEQTHIRRFDHIIKIVAFLALTVHWFNPLVWLAFILCVKDMEMSCDESVIKHMDTDTRREYSSSLLSLATGRRIMAGIPLAFGEGDTKGRIKNVLNYKQPAFWIIIAALLVVLAVGVGLATNNARGSIAIGFNISVPTILYNNDQSQDKDAYMHIASGILAKQPDGLAEEYYRGALADLDNDGQDEFILIYLDGNWEYYQLYTYKSGAPILLGEGVLFANAGAPSGGLKLVNYEGDQNLCIWKSNTEAGEKWKAAYIGQLFDIGNGELILKHTFDFNYHIDAYRYQEEVLHQDVIPENSTFLKDGKTISYEEFQEIRADLTNPIKELCSAGKEYTGFKLKDYVMNFARKVY